MKFRYIKLIGTAMLTVAMASCQDEKMADITATMPNSLRATMSGWGVESRAQVELGNQQEAQEIFQWNASDGFSLIDLDSEAKTAVRYEIAGYNADEPSATAEFVGKGELPQGHKLLAIYPQGELADGKVALSVEQNTTSTANTQEEIISYMTKNMVMIAKGLVGETQTDLKFSQATAMVRVSLTNATAEPMTLSSVSVTSPGAFGLAGEYNTAEGTVSLTGTAADIMTQEFSGLTIASGSAVDFYFLALPGTGIGDFEIAVNDEKVTVPASEFADKGISKLEAGNRYWFQLIEGNQGLLRKASVSEGVITNLPLIKAIEADQNIEFVRNADGFVEVEANKELIEGITALYLFDDYNITELSDLEYFSNLKWLNVRNNPIQSLDLTANTGLEIIQVLDANIKNVNLEGLTNLESLQLSGGDIAKMDVSSLVSLKTLDLEWLNIQEIDISMLDELVNLDIRGHKLMSLDVSKNLKLESLLCLDVIVDLTNNRQLRSLYMGGSSFSIEGSLPITTLDLSNNTNLESLVLHNCCDIETLDLSMLSELSELEIWDFKGLTGINLEGNTKLERFEFQRSPKVTSLNVEKNTNLKTLWFNGCGISEIDLSKNSLLEVVWCYETKLTALDISMLTNLREIQCQYCYLTELDITKNTALEMINCGDQRDPDNDEWGAYRELTLILTAAQEAMWKDQETWGNHVTLKVEE